MSEDTAAIEARYKLFIEKVAATKLVWGLMSKAGWANSHSGESEDVALVPFWSDRASAKICAKDDWRTYSPTEIALVDFLENWCIGMADNETLAGINWDANMFGIEGDTLNIALDILNQLSSINSAIAFKNYGSIAEFIAEVNELLNQN